MSVLVLTKDSDVVKLKVGQTPAGARGLTGEQGEQGSAFVYANFTTEQLALLKGAKGDTGSPVPITTVLGQSTTQAVSQKLLTDVLGDLESALTTINGV